MASHPEQNVRFAKQTHLVARQPSITHLKNHLKEWTFIYMQVIGYV